MRNYVCLKVVQLDKTFHCIVLRDVATWENVLGSVNGPEDIKESDSRSENFEEIKNRAGNIEDIDSAQENFVENNNLSVDSSQLNIEKILLKILE